MSFRTFLLIKIVLTKIENVIFAFFPSKLTFQAKQEFKLKNYKKINMDDHLTLYRSPWILGLDSINGDLLRQYAIETVYPDNSYVFRQGEPYSGYLYYLLKGRLKLQRGGKSGEEKTIFIIEANNFFGEATFFERSLHFASAKTMAPCTVLKFTAESLRQILSQNIELAMLIFHVLSYKIRVLSTQLEDMTFLPIEKRLSRLLLKFAAEFGRITQEGTVLPFTLTDEQLGNLVGARREAITKAFGKLRESGLVVKRRRIIYIKDVEMLRDYID